MTFKAGSWADNEGNTNLAKSESFNVIASNTAPTISSIPDQIVNVNSSTGAIAFTVGDAESPATALGVAAGSSSSDQTLVPNANIILAGTGASRTITITPASNQIGSATITVLVTDGALFTSESFVIKVMNVAPPIIRVEGSLGVISNGQSTPIDFGKVENARTTSSMTFTVWNDGESALALPLVSVPPGYTITESLAGSLLPHANDTFTVRLDAGTNGLGTQPGNIIILNNGSSQSAFSIPVTGYVAPTTFPHIEVTGLNNTQIAAGASTPNSIDGTDFGSVDIQNGLVTHTFTIINSGTKNLTIDFVTFAELNIFEFSLVSSPQHGDIIIPSGTRDVKVNFDPNVAGLRTATLYIGSDDPNAPGYQIALQGEGLGPDSPPMIGSFTANASILTLGDTLTLTAVNVSGLFNLGSGEVHFYREADGIPGFQPFESSPFDFGWGLNASVNVNRSAWTISNGTVGLDPGVQVFYAVIKTNAGAYISLHSLSITILKPFSDDLYENNDSRQQLIDDGNAGAVNSPNLGLLSGLKTIGSLNLNDANDYFSFEMGDTGTSNDYVNIDFNKADGDLYLLVIRSDNHFFGFGTITATGATVSLSGQPAGVYFANIYGSPNPNYTLTINTPIPFANLDALGNLTINGTSGDDIMRLDLQGQTLHVVKNQSALDFPAFSVAKIVVDSGDGNDVLTVASQLAQPLVYNGGAGNNTLSVEAGTLDVDGLDLGAQTPNLRLVVKNDAQVNLYGAQHLGSLDISDNARLTLGANSQSLLVVTDLTVGPNAILDIYDSALVIHPTPGGIQALLASLTDRVQSGRSGGTWIGLGITSSAAAAEPNKLTSLAIALNDKGNGSTLYSTFDGEPVNANSILIKYTYNGDADLSGKIDADDYFQIDNGFAQKLTGYRNGDFDFNGTVDADDYFLIDRAYVGQGSALAASAPAAKQASRNVHHARHGHHARR